MPPNSALEWIAGANVPRKGRSRPRRRIIAEYETEDEDDEIEFFVKSKKRTKPAAVDPPPATAEPAASPEPEPEDKTKSETTTKKSKKEAKALKSAMKKPPPPESSADSSDAAELSSDKEVETSGTESGSSPEDHLKEFDPECPCTNCIRAHRALKRSRLGRAKVKKRVSFSDDEEEETDASDDAETVHNFFKWNQAMEAKKARDQEAKDYKEFLADKAKKAEDAKKVAEKKELEARKKEEDAKRKEDEKSKKAEEEKKKKKEKGDDGENKKQKNKKEGDEKKPEEKPKDKQDKAKDKKKAVSSGETTEASASEAETSKDETGAETSGDESAKESGNKKKSKAKDKSPSASEASDSGKGEESTMIAMLMEKLLKVKEKKKKREKEKQREKARKAETRKESREKPSGHPATSFNPNWLMPPQSDIVHVEHSVETPYDPRPNAFFDNRNRVMRVYHGPNYGNPTGGLYQNPNIRSSSSPQVPAQERRPVVHPDYNMYDDNGQYVGNMQRPVQGYPPQQPQQTAAARSSPNVNQWFQGNGTTTVPGGNGDNGEVQRSKHAPEFTYDPRIFAEAEKDAYYRSPQVQDSRPRTQNNAQHPPPDSDYHTRGAQGTRVAAQGQSSSGAKASQDALEAQMKKDLEDLRTRLARTSSSMKPGTSHHNSSPVQNGHGNKGVSNQPSSRPRNSRNVAQQGNAPSTSSWDAQPSSNPQESSHQPVWTSPQQNAHSSPAWEDNNTSNSRAPNTSDNWNDSGNTNGVAQDTSSNWDNNVHSNTQNNNDWSNETTSNNNGYNNNGNNDFNNVQWSPRPASNGDNTSMPPTTTAPGGWPTSPTNQQGFSSNSGGDHWVSNAAQGWGDKSAAQSSGGYWENEGKDEGKTPDPAVAW